MNKKIAVIGAGVAGLSTAIALSGRGYRVTLLEKHQSVSTGGAGLLLQPEGVDAFSQIGIGESLQASGVPIRRLLGESAAGRRLVDIAYGEAGALSVARAVLVSTLRDEAERVGVELQFGRTVHDILPLTDGVRLVVNGREQTYSAVVLADGADSSLRGRAGLGISSSAYPWGALWGLFEVGKWAHPDTLLQRYRGTREMVGLMPTGTLDGRATVSFFWSLPRQDYEIWKGGSLEQFKTAVYALCPEASSVLEGLHTHSQLALAHYHHAWPKRLGRPRVLVVGDSAHSMSPMLGLGSTLAVRDALEAVRCLEHFGPVKGPSEYSKSRLRIVQRYQRLSRLLTPCFQARFGGGLRDFVFGTAVQIPQCRALMRAVLRT